MGDMRMTDLRMDVLSSLYERGRTMSRAFLVEAHGVSAVDAVFRMGLTTRMIFAGPGRRGVVHYELSSAGRELVDAAAAVWLREAVERTRSPLKPVR